MLGLTREERRNNQGESALGREKRVPGLRCCSFTARAPASPRTQAPVIMLIAYVVNVRQRAGLRTHAQKQCPNDSARQWVAVFVLTGKAYPSGFLAEGNKGGFTDYDKFLMFITGLEVEDLSVRCPKLGVRRVGASPVPLCAHWC